MPDRDELDWAGARDRAYRAAFGILRDRDLALDVAQQACVKALRNLDSFEGRAPFSRWVQSIAFRLALDVWRSRRLSVADPDELEGSDDPERAASVSQSASALQFCLEKLTDRQRGIFLAKYLDQMKGAEIAAEWNTREGTVWATLNQTTTKLRDCLEQRGVGRGVLQ